MLLESSLASRTLAFRDSKKSKWNRAKLKQYFSHNQGCGSDCCAKDCRLVFHRRGRRDRGEQSRISLPPRRPRFCGSITAPAGSWLCWILPTIISGCRRVSIRCFLEMRTNCNPWSRRMETDFGRSQSPAAWKRSKHQKANGNLFLSMQFQGVLLAAFLFWSWLPSAK